MLDRPRAAIGVILIHAKREKRLGGSTRKMKHDLRPTCGARKMLGGSTRTMNKTFALHAEREVFRRAS